MAYNLWKFQIDSLQIETSRIDLFSENVSISWAPVGLNFNAINLKFSEIVGHKAFYNI